MSAIHAELVEGFSFGDDAVLLAMDTAGVNTMLAAVIQAAQQGSARLDHGPTIHQFVIEPGAADIEFHEGTVAPTHDPNDPNGPDSPLNPNAVWT